MTTTSSSEAEPPDGLLVVDKPEGWSSHDVVGRVRRLAGTRRVGHAGTLDPMATGVLVLGLNRATRLLTYLVGSDKEYLATIRLGQATLTDDAEGEVTAAPGATRVAEPELEAAVAALTGRIAQRPSAVSAVKVEGRRAYARVRAGEDVALAPREVTVARFDVLSTASGRAADGTAVVDLDVAVACSSGTYIRALARDLGAALATGGHLTALRRTRVGPFTLKDAAPLAELTSRVEGGGPLGLMDLAAAARRCFPVRSVDDAEAADLRHGRAIAPAPAGAAQVAASPGAVPVADPAGAAPVAALDPAGRLIALLVERGAGPSVRAHPALVLAPA